MFNLRRKKRTSLSKTVMGKLAYDGPRPDYSDRTNDLENWFWKHEGRCVHKWHHYLPIYDRYFSRFRDQPVRMLEIGVSWGGSLQMWRDYFGEGAVIYGIDIDPKCERYNDQSAQVRIGSQDDAEFLGSVVDEMGGVDIVLDDGSHITRHIRKSFDVLYPMLEFGGVYMVEDLHANYWKKFEGGYQDSRSFIETVKGMIDDMHHWYHEEDVRVDVARDCISGIHIHDSIVVFDKARVLEPRHTQMGVKE